MASWARNFFGPRDIGEGHDPVSLWQETDPASGQDIQVLSRHEALAELARLDARQAAVVVLRFFGGPTSDEIAAAGLSPVTAKRELTSAANWLRHTVRSR